MEKMLLNSRKLNDALGYALEDRTLLWDDWFLTINTYVFKNSLPSITHHLNFSILNFQKRARFNWKVIKALISVNGRGWQGRNFKEQNKVGREET
jgi:hypothetical protein